MKTRNTKARVWATMLVVALLLAFCPAVGAGSLEPSAPPAPTMKTLDEVEPRIPIHNADLPLTITKSGSYYLVEDANCPSTAITVDADHVTIDLMGYSLIGHGAADTYGIHINTQVNVEVRGGTIRGFGSHGVYGMGKWHRIINVRAVSNGGHGITVSDYNNLVSHCTSLENGNRGISAGGGSLVIGNIIYNNGTYGIYTSVSIVTGNTVYDNESDGIRTGSTCTVSGNTVYGNGNHGINVGSSCTVSNNVVSHNVDYGIYTVADCTISGNTVYQNTNHGIYSSARTTVTGNTVSKNTGDGITFIDSCNVIDNTCNSNGYGGGDGAGIHATGPDNRIERNHITDTDRGLDIDSAGNYIADNTVKANTDNYAIAAGNQLNILLCEVPETIEWPAMVKLAGTLTTNQTAITVDSDDVTIDLGGHSLIGDPCAAATYGIYMDDRSSVEIRNGTVRKFGGYGILDIGSGKGHRVIIVRVVSNGSYGILLNGYSHLVTGCTAVENGSYGIWVYALSTLTGNVAFSNEDNGISCMSGCTVTGNTSNSNNGSGIQVLMNNMVTGNTANFNMADGIYVRNDENKVAHNTCCSNGNGGDGAGIYIYSGGNDNCIKGNHVIDNDSGIDINGTGNIIIKNTASGNTPNYDIIAGNAYGQIINVAGGGSFVNTDPTANYSF